MAEEDMAGQGGVSVSDEDAERVRRYRGKPFRVGVSGPASVLTYLERAAAERGDAPYLTVVAADGAVTTLSYRRLDRDTRRLAHWVARETGVPAAEPVGLLPVNDVASVLGLFGLLRAGHPVLMLNPADPPARLAQQRDALGVRVVLRGPRVADDQLPGSLLLPDPARLPDPSGTWTAPAPEPGADVLYFGTSGSTAASKIVAQTHANAVANAEAVRRHHRLVPGDRLLGCLPVHHVNGVHFTLIGALAAGAHTVLAERFHPFDYPRLLERHRPRIASVVPSVLDALVESWRRPRLPGDFDYFVSAAAPLSAVTARAVWDRLGARVVQGYGLTETVNFSTTMPVDLDEAAYRRLMLRTDRPPVGVAVPGNEVAVLLPDGSPAAPGQIGEVCMRGHNVMSRYVGNAEATADAFRGGWFHSGDQGYVTVDEETGHRLHVLTGRLKNIAKVRGETVSLEEMERVLRQVPEVRDAACSTVPDPVTGESVVAAVVTSGEVPDTRLYAWLARHFAAAVLPSRITRMDRIPRTPTGKILRPQLRALLSA